MVWSKPRPRCQIQAPLKKRVEWLSSSLLSLTSVMATLYGHDMHYDSMAPKEETTVHADDINRIKKELELLKVAV